MNTQREYLLLPANNAFIAFSLAGACLLNILPWGRLAYIPDFVAITLVFWNIHQPRKVGIGIAFLLGLIMDVHESALLGEHALAYSILSYAAISLHRRVTYFDLPGRMLHVLPLLLLAQLVVVLVRLIVGAPWPGWSVFTASFAAVALWPLVDRLLLAPQRRAVEHDDNRPI
jgi:rod shape-determining protein MreD